MTKLGIQNFTVPEGWLDKCKQRNNVRSYAVSGESGNVNMTTAENWKISLSALIEEYDLEHVFDIHKTGFFLRCLPNLTFSYVSESFKGGNQGKNRFTVVLIFSAEGKKLTQMFIRNLKKSSML